MRGYEVVCSCAYRATGTSARCGSLGLLVDSVESASSSLDILTLITPDAIDCGMGIADTVAIMYTIIELVS